LEKLVRAYSASLTRAMVVHSKPLVPVCLTEVLSTNQHSE